ncbi:MAG: hypothetical protein J6Y25_01405 [Elusimicrobiaceae bacterium]|nr:hypothetical protein [Elusimicrobiaceae bacterium]MBP5617304.1 hypothetical protein [Elusimicrobiaceae bacterium]
MKKNICFALCVVLFLGVGAIAKTVSSQELSRQVDQKIEQTVQNQQQIAAFTQQLAQKDPAKLANFLLEGKFAYIHNGSIIFLGVQSTGDVLVICKIEDSDVGTFYYTVHKKDNKVTEQSTSTPPTTQDFATLFKRQ